MIAATYDTEIEVIAELARLGVLPPAVGEPTGRGISSSIRDDGWDRGMPAGPRPWERGPVHASGPSPGDWVLRGYRGQWTIASTADGLSGHYRSVTIPTELVLTAAADQCLGAAYRGECPGVDPDGLMRWRAASRATFQRRPVNELLVDVAATRDALRVASQINVDAYSPHAEPLADMRRASPWPELPEAAAREGVGYVSGPLVGADGRRKYTCSGSPAQVQAWMRWAYDHYLVDIYGDPERGFAGGYEAMPDTLED